MPRLSEAIKQDHCRIEQAYRYTLTAKSTEDKLRWRNELALELARHCISEEQLKEKICRLKAIPIDDDNFEPELKSLWVDMAAHVRDTDHQDMARLEECLSITESEDLAEQFRSTMEFAPTRSNPSNSAGPPSKLITDFLATKEDSIKTMDPLLQGTR